VPRVNADGGRSAGRPGGRGDVRRGQERAGGRGGRPASREIRHRPTTRPAAPGAPGA